MAKKKPQRLRMGGTKATPKVEEKRLLRSIRALKEDPLKLIPNCDRADNRCKFCPYPKIIRRLKMVQQMTGVEGPKGEKKLMKLAKGSDMAAAYAGALVVERSGEAPRLAIARYPTGSVAFAVRGGAPKDKHIGVQHWKEPHWRAMAHRDHVKSKGIYLFDTSKGLFCTARSARYPEELLTEKVRGSKAKLKARGDHWLCPHLDPDDLEAEPLPPGIYLTVHTDRPGDSVVGLCGDCGLDNTENTLARLLEPCATKNPKSLIDTKVNGGLQPAPDCDEDLPALVLEKPLQNYQQGTITDRQLLDTLEQTQMKALEDEDATGLVLGRIYYGMATEAILEALKAKEPEAGALKAMLPQIDDLLVLSDPTPARLLNELWPDHGRLGLESILGEGADPVWLKDLESRFDGKNAHDLLRQARALKEAEAKLADLPRYRNLPEAASVADTVVRLTRTEGPREAFRYMEKLKSREHSVKAVGWSCLLVLEKAKGQEWRYTQEERDFGEALKLLTEVLLEAEGDKYHDTLTTLLASTGSTAKLERVS